MVIHATGMCGAAILFQDFSRTFLGISFQDHGLFRTGSSLYPGFTLKPSDLLFSEHFAPLSIWSKCQGIFVTIPTWYVYATHAATGGECTLLARVLDD